MGVKNGVPRVKNNSCFLFHFYIKGNSYEYEVMERCPSLV